MIEFFGLPGAGKTFYANSFCKHFEIDSKYSSITKSSFPLLEKSLLFTYFLNSQFSKKRIRLYDKLSKQIYKNNENIQSEMQNYYFAKSLLSKEINFIQKPYSIILSSLERDLTYSLYAKFNYIKYINDDGPLQRLISIYGLRNNDWTTPNSLNFIDTIMSFIDIDWRIIFVIGDFKSFSKKIHQRNKIYDLNLDLNIIQMYERSLRITQFIFEQLQIKNLPIQKVNSSDKYELNFNLIKNFISR